MDSHEKFIKLIIFRGNNAKISNILKQIYIPAKLCFSLYDTNQEIEIKEEKQSDILEY
jgi:hypothetical protein